MPFVLDTHVWLWAAEGMDRIGDSERTVIDAAHANREVFVSVISIWEIAHLDRRGRIRLSLPCAEWVNRALYLRPIELVELTRDIAIAAAQLPGPIHGDPMDRFIAATARVIGATLVTRDRRLLAYGRLGYVDVLEA